MPYKITDLDDRSIFLCACLLNAQQNGGTPNLSEIVAGLKINKNWASIFLREAKKITTARLSGQGGSAEAAEGEEGEAVETPNKKTKKSKRKATDDEEAEDGKGDDKKSAKVKKPRAKRVKVEDAGETDGNEEVDGSRDDGGV